MNVLQTYETSVMAKESPHAMHVVVVPRRSLPSPTGTAVEAVLQQLDLSKLAPTDPTNLARHLAVLLSANLPNHELLQTLASVAMATAPRFQPSEDDVRFAEFVSFERVIPFEESPLSQESLAKLATTASGVGIGAFIGFVAFGSSPFLLITVPAGMIICGAARGLGQALEEGLRERLLRWLKGEKPETARAERRKKGAASEPG